MQAFEILKNIRIKLGLSQDEMSQKLHVSQTTYSRYENGKLTLSIDKIKILKEKFGVDPLIFF